MDRAEQFIAAVNSKTSPFGIVGAGFYGMAHRGEVHREVSDRFVVCFLQMRDFCYNEGIEQVVPVSELERMPQDLFEKYPQFILLKMQEHAAKVLTEGNGGELWT